MYRYTVDNAVTYTSEDFVLFRESPFACWMERLTLENPDHGIPPDIGSEPPGNSMESQQELAETLLAEGRDVVLVPWKADEPSRRSATLAAMRQGIDFIVDGQLALGPLSGSANLLMRTTGYSELGNYLYMPCDTQGRTTLQSAFRLCFLADLLHSLQGQLPPQMLIIRGSGDLLQLQTDDHIYHYRAVKQRFMTAMREFRKHRMPDPAESSHFGRWAECANEVLRQRALREERGAELELEPDVQEAVAEEFQQDETTLPLAANAQAPVAEVPEPNEQPARSEGTLAEQAQRLQPGTYTTERKPPPYDRSSRPWAVAESRPQVAAASLEGALENLEFIGSSDRGKRVGARAEAPPDTLGPDLGQAPSEAQAAEEHPQAPRPVAARFSGNADLYPQSSAESRPHPLDCNDININVDPVVDRDEGGWGRANSSPTPTLQTGNREFEVDCVDDSDYRLPNVGTSAAQSLDNNEQQPRPVSRPEPVDPDADPIATRPFNSSLITNSDSDDR